MKNKTIREIASTTGLSKSSVGLFLKKARQDEVAVPVHEPVIESNTITEEMSITDKDASEFLASVKSGSAAPAVLDLPVRSKRSNVADSIINDVLREGPSGVEAVKLPRSRVGKPEEVAKPVVKQEIVRVSKPRVVEDPAEKGKLISKITLNVSTFEVLLVDFLKPSKEAFLSGLYKKGENELEALLKVIERARSVGNLTNQFCQGLYMGSGLVEMGTQKYLGMKTQGFVNALRMQNEEIKMIMKEIAFEQVDNFKKVQGPEARLAMIMANTLMAVNTQNMIASYQKKPERPVRAEKPVEKAEDKPTDTDAEPKKKEPPPVKFIIPEGTSDL